MVNAGKFMLGTSMTILCLYLAYAMPVVLTSFSSSMNDLISIFFLILGVIMIWLGAT